MKCERRQGEVSYKNEPYKQEWQPNGIHALGEKEVNSALIDELVVNAESTREILLGKLAAGCSNVVIVSRTSKKIGEDI